MVGYVTPAVNGLSDECFAYVVFDGHQTLPGCAMSRTDGAVVVDPLFGVLAPELGWVPPLRYLLRRERALALMQGQLPTDLLEVGCGAGALLADFSRAGFRCTGLETSARARSIASGIASACNGHYDIKSSPDPAWDGVFGMICAFDVLEHIEDDSAALADWVKWLKPGGRLLLSVPAHQSRWGAGDVWAGHYRRYDKPALLDLVARQGLRIDHVECYGFPLANLTEWLGEKTYQRLINERGGLHDKDAASAESGIQRDVYLGQFHKISSVPGRMAMRACFLLQRMAMHTNIGSGYIVLATKS